MAYFETFVSWWSRARGTPAIPPTPSRHGVVADIDDALWQVVAGDDTNGWRDITDECGALVYSNVRPGGAASCAFTLPADVWSIGYNEVGADARLVVRYAGEVAWDGIILPRPITYQGE